RALRLAPVPHPAFLSIDAPPPDLSPLSLHDALPIFEHPPRLGVDVAAHQFAGGGIQRDLPGQVDGAAGAHGLGIRTDGGRRALGDRKSTRLNSSHVKISYAVFCLKKKTLHNDVLSHT